jgi:F-type H+-transporting ATPase subunit delta
VADVVKEYGKALYELSVEEGRQSEFLGQIRFLRVLFVDHPEFLSLLRTPSIPKEERMAVIDRVLGERIETYLCSFLKLMTKRGHAAALLPCFDEYERLWYHCSGIAVAEIVTAVPLSSEQKSALLSKLEAKTGKAIEMRCTVDPSLLGGVTVTLDGKRLEGSVKGRLEALREHLNSTTLS